MMKTLKTGDYFHDFVGPLGKASDLCYEDIDELKLEHYFIAYIDLRND